VIGESIVMEINKKLKAFYHLCAKLELEQVEEAMRRIGGDKRKFVVRIRTQPNNGTIEAGIKFKRWQKPEIEEIIRLDRYADQSECIEDPEAEKFCFCKL